MIVLHGWWSRAGLRLWAEDASGPVETRRRTAVRDHPFAVPADELAKTLDVTDAEPGEAVFELPTRGRGPVASPELAVESASGAVTSARWRVPTLVLDADAALEVLRRPPNDDVVSGADLRFFDNLLPFAEGLVARGRVLPSVRPAEPDGGMALWRPVVTGADAAWLRGAVAALPAASLAADPAASAAAMAAAAVDDLTDALVRETLDVPPRGRHTWRRALTGSQRRFAATASEVAALANALDEWQRELAVEGAVRACFRLEEPGDDSGDRWRVAFALQAADEPSLVVDADQVWRSPGALRALARHVDDPHETLLRELGRVVRLWPELASALRTSKPAELTLDTKSAHEFLVEVAPMLLAAGFGVLLPGWWTNPSARLGARLRASTPSQPGATAGRAAIGQDSLVQFQWELAVGDAVLTESELADLVEAQQPLVRVRGQWLAVDADRLARARKFLRSAGGRMSVVDVLRAAGSAEGPGGLPVVGVEAEGWLSEFFAPGTERRLVPVAVSDEFVGALRPYQERGVSWLTFLETIGLGAMLADDMGLGKTVQLLALLLSDPADAGPTLLVCPMSLVGNWQREAARFAPSLRVHVHHGAERARGKAFDDAVASADLVVTTYSLLARDAAALRKVAWHRVVLDEAQAVKNAATKAAVAARSLPAQRRVAVTGTPVENRLADLWSLMEFANPGLLGPAATFKDQFARPIERHGDSDAAARLRALTQPLILRRVKTDTSIISDLPEKLEMEVVCSLTREQAALYQAVVTDMLDRINSTQGIERRGLVLATMTKLKQICNHPAQFLRDGGRLDGRSGKLLRLDETLEEVLASGEKALLFTQYAEFGAMLRSHLSGRFGREVLFLHGGVRKAERDAMVARFQSSDRRGPALFVLSLKAGGTGLTLTAANHVIHVDRWWNPAVEDQATDRAFRIGQTRAVQVRKFVCAGTLEEKISAMIRDKRELAASIVGTGEGWLTELSTDQLRELFTLEAGAVVE